MACCAELAYMCRWPHSRGVRKTAMRATIKDVSKAAEVSIKTVSRVLNNEKYVRADTRRRVEEAMAVLGFHPSAAARVLAGRRSFQIALICDNPSPYYVHAVQSAVRVRCGKDGVRMIAQPYDRESPTLIEEIRSLVVQTQPDGVILTPPVSDYIGVLDELTERGVPYVRISPGTAIDRASSTFIDNEQAAYDMTSYLIGLGHRRIGFIVGHRGYATSGQRMNGYVRSLGQAGIDLDLDLVRQGSYDFASGSQATQALLALPVPPTAIFASSDDMAAGALAAAHRLGVPVPGSLSIAGFDDTALASIVWPPLTTMRQPTYDLAYEAADLLIAGGDAIERRQLPHELVVRESTAAPGRK